MIECIAFDFFGTIVNMEGFDRDEIQRYVEAVNRNEEYVFGGAWYQLQAHEDSVAAIDRLRSYGYYCVVFSNGSVELINHLCKKEGLVFDGVVDLAAHGHFKPNLEAYDAIEKQFGMAKRLTAVVTANPTFGDVEGAKAHGMLPVVVRHGLPISKLFYNPLREQILGFDAIVRKANAAGHEV